MKNIFLKVEEIVTSSYLRNTGSSSNPYPSGVEFANQNINNWTINNFNVPIRIAPGYTGSVEPYLVVCTQDNLEPQLMNEPQHCPDGTFKSDSGQEIVIMSIGSRISRYIF